MHIDIRTAKCLFTYIIWISGKNLHLGKNVPILVAIVCLLFPLKKFSIVSSVACLTHSLFPSSGLNFLFDTISALWDTHLQINKYNGTCGFSCYLSRVLYVLRHSTYTNTHTHTCRYANTNSLHYKNKKKKNEKYILACLLVSIKWKYFAVYLDVVARMSIGSRGVWAITFSYMFFFLFSMALRWPSLVRVNVCKHWWWAHGRVKSICDFAYGITELPTKHWTMQQQQ